MNPDTGLTPAAFHEQDTGERYQPPIAQLPEDVLESEDVAMLCDPEEGLSFLIQYRQFFDIFENPDRHLGRDIPAEDESGWHEEMQLSSFRETERDSIRKLQNYYSKLGFVEMKGTPHMFLSTARRLPRVERLLTC